jgi:hypothetical protein
MLASLQVIAILLAAVGFGLSLAHALELPGKHRLAREDYLKVQTIYYPGFTIGGAFGKPGAMLATILLLLLVPTSTVAFWLTLAALACLAAEHAIYWLVTHRVNKVWLADQKLAGAGDRFLRAGGSTPAESSWTDLRKRWEISHVARATFAVLALLALVLAATIRA